MIRFAISTDGDCVSAHFGRCPAFTIVDIESNSVANKELINNPGHHPGYLPQFLHQKGVSSIICGGMGQRAQGLFRQYSIEAVVGVEGNIDDVIEKIIDGTLSPGESSCTPGAGKNYGVEKTECEHQGGE